MTSIDCTILVVAKAPVAGFAKTRLARLTSDDWAAELAAAALLDTLLTVTKTPASSRVVAMTGDLRDAARSKELTSILKDFIIVDQVEGTFADRLIAAHRDSATIAGSPVLQIGMDTPQVSVDDLTHGALTLREPGVDAVLGAAIDGGWWVLGVKDPSLAQVLHQVTMSVANTGVQTLNALRSTGANVVELPVLSDFDSLDDVWSVAELTDLDSNFREAVQRFSASRS